MCRTVIKFCCIYCFVICGVVSVSVNAIETTGDALTGNFTENRDPCSNNPCKNGGVCTVNNTGYICECKEPYSGEHCQIHPCHSNPCLNDGACIAVENTYGCVCDEPFYGKHCENDPCSSRPCKNGGLCEVDGIRFNCLCKPPYAGTQCEIVLGTTVFETTGSTASEILTSTPNGFRSTGTDDETSEHFTFGTTTNYDECYCGPNSVRCELDWWKNKVCFCQPGFGQRRGMENCTRTCSFNSDCYNYGTCSRDGPDNFCLCPEPFVGEFCQIDACDQSVRFKCDSMGAKCVVKGNTGVCECPFGKKWSPRTDFCEEICTPQTCGNHGICEVTRNNTYICKCFDGYYGRHCEISSNISQHSTLWDVIFMILVAGIVFFCIASIIAGCWVKKLKKKIGENAKNAHHP